MAGLSGQRLCVLRAGEHPGDLGADWSVCEFDELRSEVLRRPWSFLGRYRQTRLQVDDWRNLPSPLKSAILMRALSRRRPIIGFSGGQLQSLGCGAIARLAGRAMRDLVGRRPMLRQVERDVVRLEAPITRPPAELSAEARCAYLRTDLCFGLKSGGSVGHIAGVLNCLDRFIGAPVFLTSDRIPTVRDDLETHRILPDGRYWDFAQLSGLHYNRTFVDRARRLLDDRPPSLVYQRYSVNNYAGLELARHWGVPFVLEYNGSEVWIARNWGRRLKYERLTERIELLNLRAADLVVVVSRPMRDELIERGIAAERILVNPNGVDPERYAPRIDGNSVRRRYGLQDCTVIGFIGTFGQWHGAEVLAESFARLWEQTDAAERQRLRLLLVGDGVMMPEVQRRLAGTPAESAVILTGTVPQHAGPAHLAACDILASPHVPNSDGTPFFGSPTKLFEYMAMGKGIVASGLDQIAEILEHRRTAWMVKPGDAADLAAGLKVLVADRGLRESLGQAARAEVTARYTWQAHTGRILEALQQREQRGRVAA